MYGRVAGLTVISWFCYPIIWVFAEGFGNFSVTFEVCFCYTYLVWICVYQSSGSLLWAMGALLCAVMNHSAQITNFDHCDATHTLNVTMKVFEGICGVCSDPLLLKVGSLQRANVS